MFSSQEIGSNLISMKMIFEAPQSELLRFKFHTAISQILEITEFDLKIIAFVTSNEKTKFIYNLFVKILISLQDFRSLEKIPEEVSGWYFEFKVV